MIGPADKPEVSLLLLIARVVLPDDGGSCLRDLVVQDLDWNYLLEISRRHNLEPLLLHHLEQCAPGMPPDWLMRTLRENCRTIAFRNLLLSAKLCQISAHLTALQIEHISYKGPLLAEIYGLNGSLRTYRDLDLLVPQHELGAISDALAQIGFVDRYGLNKKRQTASFRSGYEHPFTSKEGIDLDVHWRIVQRFKSRALDMDGIWARKTGKPLLGQQVPAMSQEDLLVVLCLHAGHHGWTQLSHMCDIAELFRAECDFDWEIIKSHLGDSNTKRILCLTLYLLQKHWFITLPDQIESLIASDHHVEQLAHRIESEIWPAVEPILTTSHFRWFLDRSDGELLKDRMRLLAGTLFVPSIEDIASFRLPSALCKLYPYMRLFRLIWKCIWLQSQSLCQQEPEPHLTKTPPDKDHRIHANA